MKKLLALAILSSIFLAKPCFGVDWIKDRVYDRAYISWLYSTAAGLSSEIGYHYTDSIKISIEPVLHEVCKAGSQIDADRWIGTGFVAKFHYHHKFISTGITPYITAGTGIIATTIIDFYENNSSDVFVPYQIGAGINLPLSSRTSVFAGYKVRKSLKFSHGFEFGLSFNL